MLIIGYRAPDFALTKAEMQDMAEFTRTVGAILRYKRFQQFAQGRDPYGKPQPPLSRRYQRVKIKRWGQNPVLVASGEMRNSYVQRFRRSSLIEGFTAGYAAYHQSGTSKMPQRLLFEIDKQFAPDTQNRILQAALDKMEKALKKINHGFETRQ